MMKYKKGVIKIKKYPVTSQYGNDYLVKLKADGYGHTIGKLYKKVKIPFINVNISVKLHWFEHYRFENTDWSFDYISMAKRCVTKYEDNISEKERNNKLNDENKQKFAKWDGKC